MLDRSYTAPNGVLVEYVYLGVEYSYRGRTLGVYGFSESGEIVLEDDAIGTYARNEQGMTEVTLYDTRTFFLELEEDFEAFAKKLLLE